jgi:hypothetical protein
MKIKGNLSISPPRMSPVSNPPVAVPRTMAGRRARARAPDPAAAVVTRTRGLACRGEGAMERSRINRNYNS